MIRVTHFMRRPRPNAFSLERLFADVRTAMPADCRVTVWTCRNFSNGLWPRLQDMWAARRGQGDVNHVTGDVHFLTFLLDPRRTVLTVHDLVLLGRLKGVRRWIVWFLWYWLPVQRSRRVVTISGATRTALIAAVGCSPAKVRVIHNCVSEEFQPEPYAFNPDRPCILQVGTGWNKNLDRIAQALEGVPCRLSVIGPLSDSQVERLNRHRLDWENHVNLSREALLAQYIAADLVLFASIYEGFGLPILEAQAVGRPVVTSNLSSMPEVAGEGAVLVNPLEVASIRAGVLRVIRDAHTRSKLVAAGADNVARFRAAAVAENYAALYREIAVQAHATTTVRDAAE